MSQSVLQAGSDASIDVVVTMDEKGVFTLDHNPAAAGFSSYLFVEHLKSLGVELTDVEWYWCG